MAVNALQGRLGPGVLAHLLQYLTQHGAAGRLSLVSEGVGVGAVYLAGGRVIHAELGQLVGVPALSHMLAWVYGRFAFQVGQGAPRATIDLSTERLLLSLSIESDARSRGAAGAAADDGGLTATTLADPGVVPGLMWAAVVVAGPIGEIFVDDAFDAIGHAARLLPEAELGRLVQAIAGQFRSASDRDDFLRRAEAVMVHHGYGRVEGRGAEGGA